MKMNQTLKIFLKKLKKTDTQNIAEKANKIYELAQRCRKAICVMREQNSHNST